MVDIRWTGGVFYMAYNKIIIIGIAISLIFISTLQHNEMIVIGDCNGYQEYVNKSKINVLSCQKVDNKYYGHFSMVYRTMILKGTDIYSEEVINNTIRHEECHAEQLSQMGVIKYVYNVFKNRDIMEMECR